MGIIPIFRFFMQRFAFQSAQIKVLSLTPCSLQTLNITAMFNTNPVRLTRTVREMSHNFCVKQIKQNFIRGHLDAWSPPLSAEGKNREIGRVVEIFQINFHPTYLRVLRLCGILSAYIIK